MCLFWRTTRTHFCSLLNPWKSHFKIVPVFDVGTDVKSQAEIYCISVCFWIMISFPVQKRACPISPDMSVKVHSSGVIRFIPQMAAQSLSTITFLHSSLHPSCVFCGQTQVMWLQSYLQLAVFVFVCAPECFWMMDSNLPADFDKESFVLIASRLLFSGSNDRQAAPFKHITQI